MRTHPFAVAGTFLTLLCALAWGEPKRAVPPNSQQTVQSLVVEALRRAQAAFSPDACPVGVRVSVGCPYTDSPSMQPGVKDETFYFDTFSFWFRSPQRQGYQIETRCESAGMTGVLGPNCMAPMGSWSSRDVVQGDTRLVACLDEMSFDSDKAAEAARAKGLTGDPRLCSVELFLKVVDAKRKRNARGKGKATWIATTDGLNPPRCVGFDAADGKELFDGSCKGLLWW